MAKEKIIVDFVNEVNGDEFDIEIPLDITANELIYGLNKGLNLGLRMNEPLDSLFRSENPVALLRGDTVLSDYRLHQGSKIIFSRRSNY